MSNLKVFVSSTCYDLRILRAQLRKFIKDMGYEPVMSEYGDVLYDPRNHTHRACVKEVENCDILILIIGSRFGGKASLDALNSINFEMLKDESANIDVLLEKEHLSITQLEVLKAIECTIPVYTFILKEVYNDHYLYEQNKSKEIIDEITFPSIQKQGTAKYIFNFINFIRQRINGNDICTFEQGEDIISFLKEQWAGYFQRLLQEQRIADDKHKREHKNSDLSNHSQYLKTIILSRYETHERYPIDSRLQISSGLYKQISYIRIMNFASNIMINPELTAKNLIPTKDIPLSEAIETIMKDTDASVELILSEPNKYNLEDIKTKITNQRAGSSTGALYSALATLYKNLSTDTIYCKHYKEIPKLFQFYVMKTSMPFGIFNVEFLGDASRLNHVQVDLYSAALTNEDDRRCFVIWQKSDPKNYKFFVDNFNNIKNNPQLCIAPDYENLEKWANEWDRIRLRKIK